jgi:hypothetical protein
MQHVGVRRTTLLGSAVFAAALSACEPDLVVGTRLCFADTASPPVNDDAEPSDTTLRVPWSTGFENGFCGYRDAGGYCKVNSDATHAVVETPVRGGRLAAAFSVIGTDAQDALQSRCVLQGVLPKTAYYGAWYYFPNSAQNMQDWNLFHFEGYNGSDHHRLWDVSVASSATGELTLYAWDFLRGQRVDPTTHVALKIGAWVHVEFLLARAADATGRIALYLDGQSLLDVPNLVTDDTERGKWYAGNLADSLTPPDSTLYVDDVTLSASL